MSNNPGPLRLVMIDDDPGDIEIVSRYLESYTDAPVNFLPFLTTKSFEDRFQDLKPDLILLDYLLAGEDGLLLLKRIKSVSASPVIVLTGHGDERIAVEIMRAGAEDYIIKSDLSPDLLRRTIRETVKRARLLEEKNRVEEALKNSEERYRNLVERAGDGIAIVQDHTLAYVNPRFADMLGFSREALVGTCFADYIPPEDLKLVERIHSEKRAGGPVKNVYESRLIHKSGRNIEVEVNVCQIHSSATPAAMFIVRDITERKKVLKGILKAKRAAERANKAKSDFLSVVSHELRTPLTSILGFAELLFQRENKKLHTQSVSDINTILRNGKNLLRLIEEILNFKRIEAGRMEILPVPVRLNELVLEVVETVKPLLSAKPIRIETSLPPFFPAVCTDATRLRQVLINVVENSIKFTETGRVRIALLPLRPGASLVTFRISDTGIGIPRKKLKVIFRKFEQGHTGLTRKYGGAGLGLTISRSIMQLLGGDISVRSNAGKGSEFTITLPFHPAPEPVPKRGRKRA